MLLPNYCHTIVKEERVLFPKYTAFCTRNVSRFQVWRSLQPFPPSPSPIPRHPPLSLNPDAPEPAREIGVWFSRTR